MRWAVFKVVRWAGLLAVLLTGVAMALYPGGTGRNPSTRGYSIFQNSLSDLGASVAWGGQRNTAAAYVFAAGFGLLALAGVACLVTLVRLYSASPAARGAARAAATAGVLSSVALAGAALTPEDRSPALHGGFTTLALVTGLIATLLLARAATRAERFPRRVAIGWLVLAGVLAVWMAFIPWRPTTDLELAIPVTLQKLVGVAVLAVGFFQIREAERVLARPSASQRP